MKWMVTAREEQGGLRHLVAYEVPLDGVPKPGTDEETATGGHPRWPT